MPQSHKIYPENMERKEDSRKWSLIDNAAVRVLSILLLKSNTPDYPRKNEDLCIFPNKHRVKLPNKEHRKNSTLITDDNDFPIMPTQQSSCDHTFVDPCSHIYSRCKEVGAYDYYLKTRARMHN